MKKQAFEPKNRDEKGFSLKLEDVFISLVIIFVGLGGFGLGRLSMTIDVDDSGITLLNMQTSSMRATASAISNPDIPLVTQGGQLVASKNGTKYHFPWCSGAKRTKEENKIWFNSIEEARKAGYEPAANCKGLE